MAPNTCHIADGAWTTVMNWASYKPEEFQGESYGQKDVEFMHFTELPSRTREKFVLAMGQGPGKNRPTAYLESLGWKIIEPDTHLPDYASYHDFLSNSKAEWSIAKNGYVEVAQRLVQLSQRVLSRGGQARSRPRYRLE